MSGALVVGQDFGGQDSGMHREGIISIGHQEFGFPLKQLDIIKSYLRAEHEGPFWVTGYLTSWSGVPRKRSLRHRVMCCSSLRKDSPREQSEVEARDAGGCTTDLVTSGCEAQPVAEAFRAVKMAIPQDGPSREEGPPFPLFTEPQFLCISGWHVPGFLNRTCFVPPLRQYEVPALETRGTGGEH